MIKNRIIYLSGILLSVLFVFFSDREIAYITLVSLLLLPVCSFLMAFAASKLLLISQDISQKTADKLEEICYSLIITNRSILPVPYIKCIFAEETYSVVRDTRIKTAYISGRAKEEIKFYIYFKYRGMYEFGLVGIEIRDYLGLLRFKLKPGRNPVITVYPRILQINGLPIMYNLASGTRSFQRVNQEEYDTVSDIRKYTHSDQYKRIHWKISAKRNELMVKNYNSTMLRSINVILDNCPCETAKTQEEHYIIEDKIIETVIAVINCLMIEQLSIEFVCGENCGESFRNFDEIYEKTAAVEFNGSISVSRIFEEYVKEFSGENDFIVFTCNLNFELRDKLLEACGFGHHVILIYFSPPLGYHSDSIYKSLMQTDIHCLRLSVDEQITEAKP